MLNLIRTEPLTQSEGRLTAEWKFVGFVSQGQTNILCFHCHAIKRKNTNQSIQNVQNLGNERR